MRHPNTGTSLLLLATVCGCFALNYEIDGNLASISAVDVTGIETSRAAFYPYEQQIIVKLKSLLGSAYEDFFVQQFDINGAGAGKPTAVFHGYLNTSLERPDLLKALEDKDLITFYALKVDSIPQAPSLVASFSQLDSSGCSNGGLFLPNRTCACPSFYNGPQCDVVSCLHHGIHDFDRCACPPGVYAANCQPTSCLPSVQDNMDSTIQSFIVVVNMKSTMGYIVNQMAAEMPALILDIQKQNNNLLQNYILYTYGTTASAYYGRGQYFTDADSFLDAINGITLITGTADQPTNRAVLAAQQTLPGMRGFSNVFVFADSPDSDATQSTNIISSESIEMEVMLATNAWRNRLVYVLAQFDTNQIDTFGNYFDVFRRLSMATLGDLVIIDYKEITSVVEYLLYYYQRSESTLAFYQQTNDFNGEMVGDYDQQHIHVLVTVEPNGTQPILYDSKNEALVAVVMGKRFSLYRSYPSVVGSLSVKGGTIWNMRQWAQDPSTALVGYHMDQNVDVGYAMNFGEIIPFTTAAILGPNGFTGSVSLTSFDLVTRSTFYTQTSTVRQNTCTFTLSFPQADKPCNIGTGSGVYGQKVQYKSTDSYGADLDVTRIIPGYCGQLDHHEAIPFNCLNGGTRAGRNKCSCLPNYTGGNCELPKCQNGGVVNEFPGNGNPLCTCPQGYQGDFCDVLSCTLQSFDTFNYTDRTLAIVIQNSASQADINNKIITGLQTMLNTMKGSDSFTEYVVTTFNTVTKNGANTSQVMTSVYNTADTFLYALQPEQIMYKPSQSTSQDSLGALYSTIRSISNDRSSIFMFTDVPAANTYTENQIIELTVEGQLEVNTVITPPYNQPQLDLCMTAGDSSSFLDISTKTGGIYLNLCNPYGKYSQDPIVQMFINYGTVHHHTEKVVEGNSPDRSCNDTLQFFVDDPTTDFYLIVNSDVTETFQGTFVNLDDPILTSYGLAPISKMPFLAIYKFSPMSTNANGYTISVSPALDSSMGECTMKVVEKTNTAVTLGFAVDPSWDRNGKGILYSLPTHPVIHIDPQYQQQSPNISISIQDVDGSVIYRSVPALRQNTCSYQYFFDKYVCDKLFDFMTFTFTAQFSSYTVQRSMRAYCYVANGVCYNGGIRVGNGTNLASCNCTGTNYIGNNCQYPICQNGGTQSKFACICTSQYTGNLCQYPICSDFNFMEDTDVREENYKQITFITDVNRDQLLTNAFIRGFMQDFIQKSEQTLSPKQYSLVTYDENVYTNVVSSAHADVFFTKVNTYYIGYTNSTPAQTRSMDALLNAYSLNIDPPNIIFLFTGQQTVTPTLGIASLRKQIGTQVNIFYTPAAPAPLLPSSGTNSYYLPTVAMQTGGRIMSIGQYSIPSMSDMLASAIKENALIHDDGAKDCSNDAQFSFFVEDGFQSVVITATGAGVGGPARVLATDAGGNIVPLSSSKLFTDPNSISFSVDSSKLIVRGGQWTVTITSDTGSCFCQVRAITPLYIIPGFTSDLNSDFVKTMPFAYMAAGKVKNNYVAFRVKNAVIPVSINKVIISSTDFQQPWSKPTVLNTLAVGPRDPNNCAFQFISEQFNMATSQFQKFVVYGNDANNTFTFQRTFFYNMNSDKTQTCQFGTRNTFGECICDGAHSGDYCATRICQNGGTPSASICVCPSGYYGDYCEDYVSDEGLVTPTAGTATPVTAASSAAPSAQTSAAPVTTGAPATNQVTVAPPTSTVGRNTNIVISTSQAPLTVSTSGPTNGPSGAPSTSQVTVVTSGPTSAVTSGVQTSTPLPSTANTVITNGPTTTNTVTNPVITSTAKQATTGAPTSTIVPITTAVPTSTIAPTSTAIPTSTVIQTTVVPGTTTKGPCDPLWTTYLVNNFIDVTGVSEPAVSGFKNLVSELATKLGVDFKKSYTRFIITGAASTLASSDDCLTMSCINDELNTVTAVMDYPNTGLAMGKVIQQTIDNGEDVVKTLENPGFALIMLNHASTDDIKAPIQKLQKLGYIVYGIDGSAGTNAAVYNQLNDALGSQNVNPFYAADLTASWILANMQDVKCNGPPTLFEILKEAAEERAEGQYNQ